MALKLSLVKGDVLVNGASAVPGAPLAPANGQPPTLTVFPGASLVLIGDPPLRGEVASLDYTGKELRLTIHYPPGCYVSRRRASPALYDLQTLDGRVIIGEGP